MDLGSSLEQQQESRVSGLHPEEHNLPSLPNQKHKGNVFGAAVNIVLILLDFPIMCGGLSTMSLFILTGNTVNSSLSNGCILFASYDTNTDSQPFQFGDGGVCSYVTWSMASIGIVGALYMCGFCSRTFCSLCLGLSAFNLLAVIDVIIYNFLTLISISVAVIVRLGHQETCHAVYRSYPESISDNITNCSGPSVVDNHGREVSFSSNLYVTEMMSWATSILLFVISLVHFFLLIGYFMKCCNFSRGKRITNDDNEESPFRHTQLDDDDDDEPLLDPASDAWSSTIDTDDTAFRPYNLGYPTGENGSDF